MCRRRCGRPSHAHVLTSQCARVCSPLSRALARMCTLVRPRSRPLALSLALALALAAHTRLFDLFASSQQERRLGGLDDVTWATLFEAAADASAPASRRASGTALHRERRQLSQTTSMPGMAVSVDAWRCRSVCAPTQYLHHSKQHRAERAGSPLSDRA